VSLRAIYIYVIAVDSCSFATVGARAYIYIVRLRLSNYNKVTRVFSLRLFNRRFMNRSLCIGCVNAKSVIFIYTGEWRHYVI
jgi:hypothetical protein